MKVLPHTNINKNKQSGMHMLAYVPVHVPNRGQRHWASYIGGKLISLIYFAIV